MDEPDLQRDAGHLALVHGDIYRVCAVSGKGELLEIQNKVAGREEEILRKLHVERGFHGRDNRMAILIHEEDADAVKAFLFLAEKDAQRDGTLRMNGRQGSGDDGVKGAEQAEFSFVIGRGIAERCDLNFHGSKVREPEGIEEKIRNSRSIGRD